MEMAEIKTKPEKMEPENFLVSGSFIREALAIDEVRKSVRAQLLAADKLPNFSPEKMANIVNTFVGDEEKRRKKNGYHKNNPHQE